MLNVKLYTRKELAKAWGCSLYTVQDLHDSGLLKGRKFGRAWKYSEDDVQEFFNLTKGYDIENYAKMVLLKEKLDKKIDAMSA